MRGCFFSLEAAAFVAAAEATSGFAALLEAVFAVVPLPLAAFGVGFFSAGVLALVFGVLGVFLAAAFFSTGVALDLTDGVATLPRPLPVLVGVAGVDAGFPC